MRKHGTPNRTPDQMEVEARHLLKKAKLMRDLQKLRDETSKRVKESAKA